ncbi:uncharacterized protein LOC106870696 isoform X1 [Octopus bimaculoides]|uniref:Uncharacterized protein n=2 Tax=Octopus bimaculoides TaxID=37653 RepID=A0A0L8HH19_OCTBM|nr:uncharacterized protein LOC106870696 isoform X1 [Octopus bimaculoides]|eukprot:XP_014772345.1 PREDICTED: uncharacterized protein LOC106870696 isoform X1 [Octopus bimaculoides]
MAVGFKYTTITITGALHFSLGIICVMISIVGLSVDNYRVLWSSYYRDRYPYHLEFPSKSTAAASFVVSLYIIAVGVVGIFTGQMSNPEAKTRKMKKIYLILTILSASLFSTGGISAFAMHSFWALHSTDENMAILFFFGLYLMVVEFVLAIVTSSICCCCSGIKKDAVTTQRPENLFLSPVVYPPNVAESHTPLQYPVQPPNAAGAYIPPQYIAQPPNVTGAYLPPQYIAQPPNVTGAYLPPQHIAQPPNVAGAQMHQ